MEDQPLIITKAWLSQHFKHSFKWIRANMLTDEVLIHKLDYDLTAFKRWKSFPPTEGNRLKKWLADNELI